MEQFHSNILEALQLSSDDIVCIWEYDLHCVIRIDCMATVNNMDCADIDSLHFFNTKYNAVIITAYNTCNDTYLNTVCTFISRCFFKDVSKRSGDVVGSAHCALTLLLCW